MSSLRLITYNRAIVGESYALKTTVGTIPRRGMNTDFVLASLLDFFPCLHRCDPLLSQLGWALMLFALLFAALVFADPVQISGVNAWIKPTKFNLSFGMYAWTVAWWFGYLRRKGQNLQPLRWSFFITIAVEIACIALQALRNAASHGAVSTPLDAALQGTMTIMIFVNTALVIWVAVTFWRNDYGLSPAYVWAIRLGIVIFLLGNAIGGQMLAHHAHTVGAPEGTPGLPFLNWSTIAGDLRISHFLSIHAIQALPLMAFFLQIVRPHWSRQRQKVAVFLAAAGFSAFVLITYVEAMLGRPLLRM